MSFVIDDKTWLPKTINEHTIQWMERINTILEENDIRDEEGNIIKLTQNFANAVYLQVLAGANRFADNDEILQKAINSFNIELCDEQQIENLLPIASITRNPGSYSTLVLTVTASEDGECVVPAGTKAPYENVNFVVQTTAHIEAGKSQNIETVCDTVGRVAVLSGEVTSFDVQIPNCESVINNTSSIPGNAAETTESLRKRILRGQTIPYSLDGVKLALEELTGIKHARVYFNYDPSNPMTLPGDIVIQARHAYIVINGTSDKIAETYCKYMNAPTQNAPGASEEGTYTTVGIYVTAGENAAVIPANTSFIYDGMTFLNDTEVTVSAESTEEITFTAIDVGPVIIPSGTIDEFTESIENVVNITNEASVPGVDKTAYTQNYTTGSGQIIPIKYDKAENQHLFVKVFIEEGAEYNEQVENQIKRDLIAASASWVIGQNLTSLLTSVPFDECTYTTVAYTKVSTDGETWQDQVIVASNAMPIVSDDLIKVEVLS